MTNIILIFVKNTLSAFTFLQPNLRTSSRVRTCRFLLQAEVTSAPGFERLLPWHVKFLLSVMIECYDNGRPTEAAAVR
jgi:hypothetical protein